MVMISQVKGSYYHSSKPNVTRATLNRWSIHGRSLTVGSNSDTKTTSVPIVKHNRILMHYLIQYSAPSDSDSLHNESCLSVGLASAILTLRTVGHCLLVTSLEGRLRRFFTNQASPNLAFSYGVQSKHLFR